MKLPKAMAAFAAPLALAGCATPGPMVVALQYKPPEPLESPPTDPRHVRAPAACPVNLAPVHDLTEEPGSLGAIAQRSVQGKDAAAWVSDAIQSLGSDHLLSFNGPAADQGGRLTVQADLLKAYLLSLNMAKTAVVVVRVRYSRDGAPLDEVLYRGSSTGVIWVGNATESEAALNTALSRILTPLRQDILSRCQSAKAAIHTANVPQ